MIEDMLYEKNIDALLALYKSASFVVQAVAFRQTGNYISHQKDLLRIVSSDDQLIAETFLDIKNGKAVDFNPMSEALFAWAKKYITESC